MCVCVGEEGEGTHRSAYTQASLPRPLSECSSVICVPTERDRLEEAGAMVPRQWWGAEGTAGYIYAQEHSVINLNQGIDRLLKVVHPSRNAATREKEGESCLLVV